MQPLLVLIHGFLENAGMWKPLASAFNGFDRQFIPDLPGHGSNSNQFRPSIGALAAELLENINLQYPNAELLIAGHSMGGYIAAEMAALAPGRVRGLVFFHSTAQKDSEAKKLNRLRAVEALEANKELYIGTMIRSLFASAEDAKTRDIIEQLIKSANRLHSENIRNCLLAMRDRSDLSLMVKSSGFPVLYILGDNDSRLPLNEMLPEIKAAEHISAHVIENCGHMSQWEYPERAAYLLKQWIDKTIKN